MDYTKLITTISVMLENEDIETEGLTLVYHLPEDKHNKMNQDLYYRTNPAKADFKASDEFEVEIGGILVKFIKK